MVAFITSPIDTLLQGATRARAPGRTCTAVPTLPCKHNSRCDLRETKLAPNTRWGSRSRDPIGYGGGQLNVYEFVRSQPSTLLDPSGLVCCDCKDGERKVVAGKIPEPTYQLGNIYWVDFSFTIRRYALRTSWEKLTFWHGPKECGNYMNPSWPLFFIDPHRTFEFGAEVGINFPGGGIAISMSTTYHSAEAVFLEDASEKPQQDPCYIHEADLYVEMVETGFHYTRTAGDPMRGAVDDFVPMDFDLIPTLGTPPKWYTKNWRVVVYATCCSGNKK